MPMMIRVILIWTLFATLSTGAIAQSDYAIPDELMLNRFGLTLDWWGRAVINGNRDTVLHLTADEQNVYVQSRTGSVTVFNGESGNRLWSSLVGAPDHRSFAGVTNDEELLIATGMQLFSLNKNTGDMIWQLRSPQHPSTSPSVNDTQVAIGSIDGSVYAFDLKKVRELHQENMLPEWSHLARQWRFKAPTTIVSPPVFAGQALVFASERGNVYGLTAINKAFKFQFESDSNIHTPLGSSKDYILVTNEDSRMYCLNKESGRIRWTYSSGAPIRTQPRVVGSHVFVTPTREGMDCLTLSTGRKLWTQPKITEFIAASETRVYASDISGHLMIMDIENGDILGRIPLRHFDYHVQNERTDRIFVCDKTGLVLGLREISSEFPIFHLYPERRPILPLLASESDAADNDAAGNDRSDDSAESL